MLDNLLREITIWTKDPTSGQVWVQLEQWTRFEEMTKAVEGRIRYMKWDEVCQEIGR
jgi:hypothetical protein